MRDLTFVGKVTLLKYYISEVELYRLQCMRDPSQEFTIFALEEFD
jgi:hypothetical protein